MKATVNGTVIAEAPDTETISIEGNAYFPSSSLVDGVRAPSDRRYTCPWKGAASYYDLTVGSGTVKNGAWSYDDLKASAIQRVGRDFSGYVAFDRSQVDVGA